MTTLPAASTPRERLVRLVLQLLQANGATRPLSCDIPLSEVGLTSLDMVNLMFAVEGEFDIVLPQSAITLENFGTLAAIESLVARLVPQPVAAGR